MTGVKPHIFSETGSLPIKSRSLFDVIPDSDFTKFSVSTIFTSRSSCTEHNPLVTEPNSDNKLKFLEAWIAFAPPPTHESWDEGRSETRNVGSV